jgi:DNA-binding response OmpR family regulator
MSDLESIARLLAQRGALPEPALRRAVSEARGRAAFLGSVLQLGVSEPDLVGVVAQELGMPGVDLSRTSVDLAVLGLIPRMVAEADLVLPLSSEGGRLHIAISAGKDDHEILEELRFATGMEISAYAALPGPLEVAIAAAYDGKDRGERVWRGSGLLPDAQIGVAVILPGEFVGALDRGPRTEEIEEPEAVLVGDDEEDEEVLQSVEVRVGPARILAVDDDAEILRLLDRTLRSAGYAVELARDGREAEEKLQKGRYDLVLLDAMLPHVHGFEICARLKASARTRALPVILCSAIYKGWRYASDAREAFGADDFIEKPFHLPELLKRVETGLSGKSSQQPHPSEKAERLYQKGMGLLEAKQPAEARPVLEEATREDPLSARSHFALARAMHQQGDLFHAMTEYERAVELRPNLFQALRALAGLYQEKGFRRKAVEALERALHAAPDAPSRDAVRAKLIELL